MNSYTALILALAFVLSLTQHAKPDHRTSPAVRLEIRLAEFDAGPGLIKSATPDPKLELYLHEQAVATNKDILEARVEQEPVPEKSDREMKVSDRPDYSDSDPSLRIRLKFTQEAAEKIAMATEDHIGKPVAILVDGKMIAYAIVRSAIHDEAVIDPGANGFTRDEVQRIVNALNKK
jgi:SecD-like export protein